MCQVCPPVRLSVHVHVWLQAYPCPCKHIDTSGVLLCDFSLLSVCWSVHQNFCTSFLQSNTLLLCLEYPYDVQASVLECIIPLVKHFQITATFDNPVTLTLLPRATPVGMVVHKHTLFLISFLPFPPRQANMLYMNKTRWFCETPSYMQAPLKVDFV